MDTGTFHVVNQGVCTWHAFARTILELSHRPGVRVDPISSRELNRDALRPSYSVLHTQKFSRETGMALRQWPEALKDYLRLAGEEDRSLPPGETGREG